MRWPPPSYHTDTVSQGLLCPILNTLPGEYRVFLFNGEMQPAYQIINCTFLNFLTNDFNILLFMVELNEADADWNIVTVTGTQRSDTELRAFLNIYEAFRARV